MVIKIVERKKWIRKITVSWIPVEEGNEEEKEDEMRSEKKKEEGMRMEKKRKRRGEEKKMK